MSVASEAGHLGLANLSTIVGKRVAVFWPDEDEWFEGVITSRQEKVVHVQYDDGDNENVTLGEDAIKFVC